MMKKTMVIYFALCMLMLFGCSGKTAPEQTDTQTIKTQNDVIQPVRVLSSNPYTNGRMLNGDCTQIANVNGNGDIYIQSLANQETLAIITTGHEHTVMDVVFSQDNQKVVVTAEDWMEIYNVETNQLVYAEAVAEQVLFAEYIKDDAYLVLGTGAQEQAHVLCNFNAGTRISEPITDLYTMDLSDFSIVNSHHIPYTYSVLGLTDDQKYVCTDGGENHVISYGCFSDDILYDFQPELYQNVSFYPFDAGGKYFVFSPVNDDFLQIISVKTGEVIYELDGISASCYLGGSQIAYYDESSTLVIYDFETEKEIIRSDDAQLCLPWRHISGTDHYVGFQLDECYTERFYLYDVSNHTATVGVSAYTLGVGMYNLYDLEDRSIFLYWDKTGWSCDVYDWTA